VRRGLGYRHTPWWLEIPQRSGSSGSAGTDRPLLELAWCAPLAIGRDRYHAAGFGGQGSRPACARIATNATANPLRDLADQYR
jgi:hypothetical protein